VCPDSRTVYCIDTSILIDLHRHYPRDIFGRLWSNLEALVREDRAIAPKQVREELKAWDDSLYQWAVRQRRMFRGLGADQVPRVAAVLAAFPALAHSDRRTEAADPFLVALALAEKETSLFGADYCVVTSEARRPKGQRIPNACEHFGLRCLSLFEFMKAEGWKF